MTLMTHILALNYFNSDLETQMTEPLADERKNTNSQKRSSQFCLLDSLKSQPVIE